MLREPLWFPKNRCVLKRQMASCEAGRLQLRAHLWQVWEVFAVKFYLCSWEIIYKLEYLSPGRGVVGVLGICRPLWLELLFPLLLQGKQSSLCSYIFCDSSHARLFRPITLSRGNMCPIAIDYSSRHVLCLDILSMFFIFSSKAKKNPKIDMWWEIRCRVWESDYQLLVNNENHVWLASNTFDSFSLFQ